MQDQRPTHCGMWTLLQHAYGRKREEYWLCECKCGTRREVRLDNLLRGLSKSCGCNRGQKENGSISNRPEYIVWMGMRQRCNNPNAPNFHHYGGRGIRVCSRWQGSFATFLEDMGPRPSPTHKLERRDVNGPYEPENCSWGTQRDQCNNKRNSHFIAFQGRRLTVTQWGAEIGIPADNILHRIRAGWSIEDSLTKPVRRRRVSL